MEIVGFGGHTIHHTRCWHVSRYKKEEFGGLSPLDCTTHMMPSSLNDAMCALTRSHVMPRLHATHSWCHVNMPPKHAQIKSIFYFLLLKNPSKIYKKRPLKIKKYSYIFIENSFLDEIFVILILILPSFSSYLMK